MKLKYKYRTGKMGGSRLWFVGSGIEICEDGCRFLCPDYYKAKWLKIRWSNKKVYPIALKFLPQRTSKIGIWISLTKGKERREFLLRPAQLEFVIKHRIKTLDVVASI